MCHTRIANLQIAVSGVATFDLTVERCNKGGYLLEELGIDDIDALLSQYPADPVGQQWRIEFDLASPRAWRVFAQFAARSYYDAERMTQPAQFHSGRAHWPEPPCSPTYSENWHELPHRVCSSHLQSRR